MNPFDVRRKIHKEPINLSPAFKCPAIERCVDAWYRAYQSAESRGVNQVSSWLRANEAYRNAMPPLDTPENIRDFVACLNHGIIINTIVHPHSAQLLKAATLAAQISRNIPKVRNPTPSKKPRAPKAHPHTD